MDELHILVGQMTDKVTSLTSRNTHGGVGYTRLDVAFKIIELSLLCF